MTVADGNYFDAETLQLLANVLDEAWNSIPPNRQINLLKSDMAERILRSAVSGERDAARLRAAALAGLSWRDNTNGVGSPPMSSPGRHP
jgi:hypothetical protein